MSVSIEHAAKATAAMPEGSLTQLLRELDKATSLPLDQARMPPPAAYLSQELAELERKMIFGIGWSCIGRVEQLSIAGDYLAYDIAGQPVVAIRQKDGSIKAFSNVCLHRCTTLVDGAGHLPGSIVCPYHAWTYNYDGVLRGTPHSDVQHSAACKSGQMRLRQFKVELWNNWIFVSLNPLANPLAPQLEGLLGHMPGVDLGQYQNVVLRDEIWDVNWKLLTENFIESYHLFMVHSKTIEPWCSTRTARFVEGGPAYTLHHCPTVPGTTMNMVAAAKPADSNAAAADPNFGIDFCIFPSFMAAGDRTQVWWMALQPKGALQTAVRYGFCVTPDTLSGAKREDVARDAAAWLDTANGEDKAIITRVMRGIAGPITDSGTLGGRQDRPVWEFNRYISRMLNSAV